MGNPKQTQARKALSGLLARIKPYRGLVLLVFVLSAAAAATELFIPILTGKAVDCVVGAGDVDFSAMKKITAEIIAAALVSAACWRAQGVLTNRLAFFTVRDIRTRAFARLTNARLSAIDKHARGDLVSRITTDTEQISDGLILGFSQLFSGLVTIAATMIFMLSVNVNITLLVIFITPLSIFTAKFIAGKTFSLFRAQSQARGELTALADELIANRRLVLAFHQEEAAQKRFDAVNEPLRRAGERAVFYSSLVNPVTRFVNGLVFAGVGVFGAFSAISGVITVGQLSAFLTYANQYTKPFNEISGVISELQNALASASRVFELTDGDVFSPEEEPESPQAFTLSETAVEFDDVGFSYSPDRPLIAHFDLSVKRGERVAIVGATGCGKTTLINLLMRFYDVCAGEIRVGGTAVKHLRRRDLRGSFGMVLQDTWLKTATVAENIAYGKPDATRAEIEAAAKACCADGFIRRLPMGYDTVISDEGGVISHGQKQLLCIARAMLTAPEMLILDEATSSVDLLTEVRIQRAFAQLMAGRTSFVVAHRLSTVREADCILVMDAGKVVERGTHMQLLAAGGLYAKLCESQLGGAGESS
ncbi:MAG: ABC transporter ATP-binding protein [Oscillospiraceae bacterium]